MKIGNEIRSFARLNRKIINSALAAARRRFKRRSVVRGFILGAILLNILAFPANVSFTGLQASLAQGTVEVWWPKSGEHLQGTQPFKAMVSGLDDISGYEMYWQVDGGQENKMDNSDQDYPHKESSVDLSSWDWRGQGPYEVTFLAKKGGTVVAKSSVTVYNDGASTASAPQDDVKPGEENSVVTESQPLVISDHGEASELAQKKNSTTVPEATKLVIEPIKQSALYVDPNAPAVAQANEWRTSRPDDAKLMDTLAAQATSKWLGGWSGDVESTVKKYMSQASGKTAVFVAYNIPQRDCGGYSAGGVGSSEEYLKWIGGISRGIGQGSAMVVLEPDALAGMGCLSQADQNRRMDMLASAVSILKSNANTKVYIDAGHSGWMSSNDMSERLKRAGISKADGFSLNVSNFMPTDDIRRYGKSISEKVGNKHFVIDTSRNGNGSNGEWCNPTGRKVGEKPTTSTGSALVDAYLWIKMPGESDGNCNGGPSAGAWWPEYALSLLR